MDVVFEKEEARHLRSTIEPASNVVVVKADTSQSPERGLARVRARVSVGGSPTRPTAEAQRDATVSTSINQQQVDFRDAREYYMRQQPAKTRKGK